MSTRTKLGLGFKEYIGSDEVCDLSTPSVFDPKPNNREVKSLYERFVKAGKMHKVPPPITGTFMPTSYQSDLAETQATFETYDFVSCVLSPKTNESFSTVDVKLLPKSDVKDLSITNDLPSCSFKEIVKPPRNLYNFPSVVSKAASVPVGSRNSSASISAGRSIPAASINESASIHAGRSIPAASRNGSASIHVGSSIPAASRNGSASIHAGRSIPATSRNRSASIYVGRSIPAASGNKPASIHAGKHIPAGRINKPAPFLAGSSVVLGDITDLICNGVPRTMVNLINLHGFSLNDPQGRLKLKEVLLHLEEEMNYNLFFVSQICDKKNKVLFTDAECLVLTKEFQLPDESQVVLQILRRHDLYTFNLSDIQPEQHINFLLAKASLEESTKWHRRMTHVNFKTINKLAKHGLVKGLPLKLFTNEHNCVACNKGKQHKASYKAISAYYFLVVTDDFSRFCWAFFMVTKDETFYILKEFIALIENNLNKKVKAIRCDNDIEFQNAKLIALCEEKGIKRDYSNARTPQQNKVILVPSFPSNSFSGPTVHDVSAPMENNLDYVAELARLQRQEYEAHSAAAKPGFEFFVDTAALLPQAEIEIRRNLVPATGDPAGSTVSTSGVPAGSLSTSGVPTSSLPTSSVPAGSLLASCVPASSVPTSGVLNGSIVSTGGIPAGSVPASGVPAGSVLASSVPASGVLAGSIVSTGFGDPAASASVPAVLSTTPATTSPLLFGHSLGSSSNVVVDLVATKRVNIIHPQSQIIRALQSPQVWKLVPLPDGKIAIGTKWILKNKRDARGIVVRNKARLVAPGHRQEEGINYDEVYVDDIIFGSINKAWCDEFDGRS
nr:putative ribonuclease H-like domain-containing protein [Tanacetum cinerariifolium]